MAAKPTASSLGHADTLIADLSLASAFSSPKQSARAPQLQLFFRISQVAAKQALNKQQQLTSTLTTNDAYVLVLQIDQHVLAAGTWGSPGNKTGMRQLMAVQHVPTTAFVTADELKYLKLVKLMGRRAPKAALISVPTALEVLEKAERFAAAKRLQEALTGFDNRTLTSEADEQAERFTSVADWLDVNWHGVDAAATSISIHASTSSTSRRSASPIAASGSSSKRRRQKETVQRMLGESSQRHQTPLRIRTPRSQDVDVDEMTPIIVTPDAYTTLGVATTDDRSADSYHRGDTSEEPSPYGDELRPRNLRYDSDATESDVEPSGGSGEAESSPDSKTSSKRRLSHKRWMSIAADAAVGSGNSSPDSSASASLSTSAARLSAFRAVGLHKRGKLAQTAAPSTSGTASPQRSTRRLTGASGMSAVTSSMLASATPPSMRYSLGTPRALSRLSGVSDAASSTSSRPPSITPNRRRAATGLLQMMTRSGLRLNSPRSAADPEVRRSPRNKPSTHKITVGR